MNLRKELDRFYYSTALCDLRLMNENFVDKNISYNSLLYMEIIFSLNGKCTSSKLAELLNVSKPAVTLKVNELINQGFVTKTQDPFDKRKWYLSVDEKNVPKYKFYKAQDNMVIRSIKEKFSEEDIDKFCKMLRIMSDTNYAEIDAENRNVIKYKGHFYEF